MGGLQSTPDEDELSSSGVRLIHSSRRWHLHFDQSKLNNQLMVVGFAATWCGPCKFMEPAIIELAAKYSDVEFLKIDVEQLADVAKEYNVDTMPTFVLLKQGKVVGRVVGAQKEELENKIMEINDS